MTHRERVRAVLAGKRPDRPVCDLGGRVASMNEAAYRALKAHLGFGSELDVETVTLLNTIGVFDERVLDRLDIPIRRVCLKPPSTWRLAPRADGTFLDEWGVVFRPAGPYNERIGHPLAAAHMAELDAFPWPAAADPGRTAGLAAEARRLFTQTDSALAAGHVSAGVFQDCWNLRGMARFLEDMALDADFAGSLLDRVLHVHEGFWSEFLGAVGPYVDIVETADDLGSQTGLLISPAMYRRFIKPRHAALHAAIKARTQAKLLYHSCGAIAPLIDDLLDTGVDILNPIQPVPGMEPEALGKRYGARVVFHGGLDVQDLLPNGTPASVRAHVRRYRGALGDARFIMAPANTIPPGTPPGNVVAAYDAVAGDGA